MHQRAFGVLFEARLDDDALVQAIDEVEAQRVRRLVALLDE
ncbi:MAG: hypothetical protein AAF690_23755 [Acidobacteriota bacterium]